MNVRAHAGKFMSGAGKREAFGTRKGRNQAHPFRAALLQPWFLMSHADAETSVLGHTPA
jgi:hypothetical protein